MTRLRLDEAVVAAGLAPTRAKAQALILAGEIAVDGKPGTKPGHAVPPNAKIDLAKIGPRYVSRGGHKLAGALDHFGIDPKGFRCLDVGASTGGFTDCLLQRGAAHVIAVDVGTGQMDQKIRNHPKVTSFESLHARDLTTEIVPIPVDLAVVDVSFISLTKVLPFVVPFIRAKGLLLALVKPQFEASRKDVPKGVLRDENRRQEILAKMLAFVRDELRLTDPRSADAVLKGPKGNQEAFIFAKKTET